MAIGVPSAGDRKTAGRRSWYWCGAVFRRAMAKPDAAPRWRCCKSAVPLLAAMPRGVVAGRHPSLPDRGRGLRPARSAQALDWLRQAILAGSDAGPR